MGGTSLGQRLAQEVLPLLASSEELAEFGALLLVNAFPPLEKTLLLNAILPQHPVTPMDRRRLATYGAFLACAAGGQPQSDYRRILTEAVLRERALPEVLASILDGWVHYLVRDLLAVVHEFAFHTVLLALPRNLEKPNQAPEFQDPADVVRTTLRNAHNAIEAALKDLGLIEIGEAWDTLHFSTLDQRVQLLTSRSERIANGIRFWEGGLQEPDLIRVINQTETAAPALLLVAWLLAERRVGVGVRAGNPAFQPLSHDGFWRLGLEHRVIPTLDTFRKKPITFGEAAADLTFATVEQHLHTAWGRLANNGNDVSVLLTDGNRWAYRKNFYPGQMDSRLSQVSNWAHQLGLLTPGGLTVEGEAAMQGILTTLEQEVV